MKTIQLNIPDMVDFDEREAKMLLASRLYEKGKVTLGQAAVFSRSHARRGNGRRALRAPFRGCDAERVN